MMFIVTEKEFCLEITRKLYESLAAKQTLTNFSETTSFSSPAISLLRHRHAVQLNSVPKELLSHRILCRYAMISGGPHFNRSKT